MHSIYRTIAQLCELRDSILLARLEPDSHGIPTGISDALREYSLSISMRSDALASYHIELVASFMSGGGEESSYCMEKRVSILLCSSRQQFEVRCSSEADVFEESYALDESGSLACLKRLREFFA